MGNETRTSSAIKAAISDANKAASAAESAGKRASEAADKCTAAAKRDEKVAARLERLEKALNNWIEQVGIDGVARYLSNDLEGSESLVVELLCGSSCLYVSSVEVN